MSLLKLKSSLPRKARVWKSSVELCLGCSESSVHMGSCRFPWNLQPILRFHIFYLASAYTFCFTHIAHTLARHKHTHTHTHTRIAHTHSTFSQFVQVHISCKDQFISFCTQHNDFCFFHLFSDKVYNPIFVCTWCSIFSVHAFSLKLSYYNSYFHFLIKSNFFSLFIELV